MRSRASGTRHTATHLDLRHIKAALHAEVVAIGDVQCDRGQLQHQMLAALIHAVALRLVHVRLWRPDLRLRAHGGLLKYDV